MLFLQKTVILCLAAVQICAGDKVSFKHVSLQLRGKLITVTSTTSLKSVVPPGNNVAKVYGAVPVLYENSVADLQGMQYLQFDNVGLREIHPGAFKRLSSDKLSLNDNNIRVLRENSFSHIHISTLELKSNSISTLEPGVFKHSDIDSLSIQNNSISKIPRGLFKDVIINNLDFRQNNLGEIEHGAFLGMQRDKLQILQLSDNKLEKIDPETFNFPHLRVLDLNYNLINVIRPGDLRNLPELKTVFLEENGLKEIADGVFSNSKIVSLYLGFNEISSVSSRAFDNMAELSELYISSNKLTRWDKNWFRNTPKLEHLRFQNNKIQEIPDNAFQNLKNPFSVSLQNNKIRNISPNLGTDYRVLVTNNEIKSIEGGL